MRIERVNNDNIRIVLSRRNLQSLLAKLDIEWSAKTIYQEDDQGNVWVSAEENDIHYEDRTPGPMHPATESAL